MLEHDGIVVRYGQLYGSGTFYPDELASPPRVHVDDAAQLTMRALHASSGTTLVVEDENGGGERTAGTIHELSR